MGRVFDIRKKRFLRVGEISETLKRVAAAGPRSARAAGVFDVRTGRFLSDQQVVQRRIAQLVKKGGEQLRQLNPAEKVQLKELKESAAKIPKITRVTAVRAQVAGTQITRKDLSEAQKGIILDRNVINLEKELKALESEKASLLQQEKTIARKDITAASKFNLDVKKFNQKIKDFNRKSEGVKLDVQDFNRELQRKAARGEITLIGGEKITRLPTAARELLDTGIAREVEARRPKVGVQPIEDIGAAITKRTQETLLGFGEIGGAGVRGGLALGAFFGGQELVAKKPTEPLPVFLERAGRAAGITAGAAFALPEAVLQQAFVQTVGLSEEVVGRIKGKPPEPLKFRLTGISEKIVRGAKEAPFGIGALFGAEEAVTPEGVFLTRPALSEFASAVTFLALPALRAKPSKAPTKAKVPTTAKVTKIAPTIARPETLLKVTKKAKPITDIKFRGFQAPLKIDVPIKAPPSAVGASLEGFAKVIERPGKKPPIKKPPTKLQQLIARERIQLLGEKPVVTLPKRVGVVPEVVKRFRQAEKALLERATRPIAERAVAQRISRIQAELALERGLAPITTEIAFQRQFLPSLGRQFGRAVKAEIVLETAPVRKALVRIERKVGRKFTKFERELLAAREDVLFTLLKEPKIKIQESLFRLKREARLLTPLVQETLEIPGIVGRRVGRRIKRPFVDITEQFKFPISESIIEVQQAIFRAGRDIPTELRLGLKPTILTKRRLERKIKRKVTKPLSKLQREFEEELGLAAQDVRFTFATEPRIKLENIFTRAKRDVALEAFFAKKKFILPVEERIEAFRTGVKRQIVRPLRKEIKGPILEEFFIAKKEFKTFTKAFETEVQAKVTATKFAAEAGLRVPIRQVARAQIAAEAVGKRIGFELGVFRPFRPGAPILEGVQPRIKRPEPFRLVIIEPKKGRGLPSFKKNIFEEEIKGPKTIVKRITIKEALGFGKESVIGKALAVKKDSALAKALGIKKESQIAKSLRVKQESAISKALKDQQKLFGKDLDGFVTIIKAPGKVKPMKPFVFPTKLKPKKKGVFFREFKPSPSVQAGQIQVTKTGAVTIQKVKTVTKVKKPTVITEPTQQKFRFGVIAPTIQETLTVQGQKFRQLTGFGVKRPQRFAQAFKPIQVQIPRTATIQRQRFGQRFRFAERVAFKPIEALKTVQELKPRQAFRLREGFRLRTGIPPRTILREITRPKPPRLVPIILGLPGVDAPQFRAPADDPEKGFNVFIRRKGKLIRRNKVPLTRPSAFGLGFLLADQSVARSGVVRDAKEKGKSVPALNRVTAIAFKFRKPKGKTKLARDSFVERSRFAIDSSGELRGITAKGRAKAERNRSIRKVLRLPAKRRKPKGRKRK